MPRRAGSTTHQRDPDRRPLFGIRWLLLLALGAAPQSLQAQPPALWFDPELPDRLEGTLRPKEAERSPAAHASAPRAVADTADDSSAERFGSEIAVVLLVVLAGGAAGTLVLLAIALWKRERLGDPSADTQPPPSTAELLEQSRAAWNAGDPQRSLALLASCLRYRVQEHAADAHAMGDRELLRALGPSLQDLGNDILRAQARVRWGGHAPEDHPVQSLRERLESKLS